MAQSAQSQPEEERMQDQPEQQTQLSIVDGQAPPLSLTALHTALTERGVQMPYSSLAQFIGLGDIAEQLGVGGKGNRREFPRWSVDFLADFLAWYTTAGIKKELAPDAVRHRLAQFRSSDEFRSSQNSITQNNSITRSGSVERELFEEAQYSAAPGQLGLATRLLSGILAPVTAALDRLAPLADLPAALREFAAAAHRQQDAAALPAPAPPAPMEDRLLTAEQAAEMLACHPRTVSKYVTPVRPRTWRYSDCLRYIDRVGKALEEAQKETKV